MHDFIFHNPTKIIFGRDKEREIGAELKAAGVRKVLFVYGRNSIVTSGLFGRIVASLGESGIEFVEFGGVVSNPQLSHARQGVAIAKAEQVDAILAVGGGSVLDEAKGIAVGALADEDMWAFYEGREVERALPVFTVLTIAATGSEMNGNSVITNEKTKAKWNISSIHVYPQVSIINPALTCTVPPDYTAYSAVDAIAHVIEGYFTKQPGSRLQDRLVESVIRTVIDTTDLIMEDPDNYAARAEFAWAATLALNGLTPAGIGPYGFPNHMIEHSLSALYDIAHGAGLAIVMPAWMRWYSTRTHTPSQFDRFAAEIFGVHTAAAGIDALEQWFRKIGAPVRLAEAAIPGEDIERIAENAARLAKRWRLGEAYPAAVIAEILQLAV
ncbi:MAG: iron-containing alcohol dehydrogenase [Desulfobulbaceae bacterium]|nr:iron-containing alcohol dehydrogenase [Desulfobulbaceae bacterium]